MISVCVATYNGEKYIKQQIDSILSQLSPFDEIIISDDGSTDKTIDILLSYHDNRIKVLSHHFSGKKECVGDIVSANFENALKIAQGDYIFLSDQDDIWIEGKVKKMVMALQKAEVAVSNAWILTEDNINNSTKLLYDGRNPLKNYFLKKGKYYGCCMAFRAKALSYVLPFPQPLPLHDTWLGLLPEIVGGAVFIDEPLIYYRLHNSNVSSQSHNSFIFKIKYRLRIIFQIFIRAIKYKLSHKE